MSNNIEVTTHTFECKGGCTECVLPISSYQKIYVSDGSLGKVYTVSSDNKSCKNFCTENINDSKRLPKIIVECNLTRYSCVILESWFKISTGEWKGKRVVLYGRYRGQKMIDVRDK